jgi:MFS family permease
MHPEQLFLSKVRHEEAVADADAYRARRVARRVARRRRAGFLRLWWSAGSSNLADGVLFAGLPVLATQVTESPALIAGVTVALMLPMALIALPAGVVADRFDRRRILVVGNLVRVVGIAAVLVAVAAGELTLAAIYAVAAIAGGSELLVDTTAQTAVPALVGRDELEGANARLGGTQVVMNDAVGAPIGSFLAGMGVGFAFGLPALLFAAAAVLLRRLPMTPGIRGARPVGLLTGLRTDVRDGVRYLAGHEVLRRLAVVGGASNLGNTAFFAVFVVFVVGPLDLPVESYGWFLAAVALGGLGGSVVAGRLLRWLGHAATLKLAFVLIAGTYLAATATSSWRVMAVCVALLGAISMVCNVGSRVLRQTLVPDALLGRVTATMALVALVATPLGGVVGGLVAEVSGVRAAGVVAVGANLLALALLLPVTATAIDAARRDARGEVLAA